MTIARIGAWIGYRKKSSVHAKMEAACLFEKTTGEYPMPEN